MSEINQARSVYYSVLSLLFMDGAARKNREKLTALLGAIADTGFDREACESAARIRSALEKVGAADAGRADGAVGAGVGEENGIESLDREFFALFLTPFGGGVAMSASVYHDSLEAGKPLIAVKEAMNIAALRKNNFSEHEDNFGFLFTLMAKLCGLRGQSDAENGAGNNAAGDARNNAIANAEKAAEIIYRNAIAPYAAQFAGRVKNSDRSVIYKDAAVLLERFLRFEAEFYARSNG